MQANHQSLLLSNEEPRLAGPLQPPSHLEAPRLALGPSVLGWAAGGLRAWRQEEPVAGDRRAAVSVPQFPLGGVEASGGAGGQGQQTPPSLGLSKPKANRMRTQLPVLRGGNAGGGGGPDCKRPTP